MESILEEIGIFDPVLVFSEGEESPIVLVPFVPRDGTISKGTHITGRLVLFVRVPKNGVCEIHPHTLYENNWIVSRVIEEEDTVLVSPKVFSPSLLLNDSLSRNDFGTFLI